MARKIYCLRAAKVGGKFSTGVSFAKNILLYVFKYVVLNVALHITTKYGLYKAIPSSYISLFCCTDTSFTNTFVISGKSFHHRSHSSFHHSSLFTFTNYLDAVSQLLRLWKKGRGLAGITQWFDNILRTAIYFKSFPFPNSTHNSCNLAIRWYADTTRNTT